MNLLETVLISMLIGTFLVPVFLALASYYAGEELILNSLNRFMVLIQGPFDYLRNTTRILVNFIWNDMIKRALRSVGITREHWIQRTIGAVLFSFVFLAGVLVLVMNNVLTLEGLFGTEGVIKNYIPIDVELLIAIEIVAAIIASGGMVLDVVGLTHLLKFLSPDFLSVPLRWIIGSLMTIMFAGGVYLLVVFGLLRTDLLKGQNESKSTDIMNSESTQLLLNESSANTDSELINNVESDKSLTTMDNSVENESTKTLMCGMPIVSAVPGVFAALGLIPLGAIVAVIPLLILQMFVGFFYQTFSLLCRIIDLLYNFLDSFFNVIISAVRSIRERNRRIMPVQNTPVNQETSEIRGHQPVDIIDEPEEIINDISDEYKEINDKNTASYGPIH